MSFACRRRGFTCPWGEFLFIGALSGVKGANEEGQKKLLQMMDDENKPIKKAPKVKNKEDETKIEIVKPKDELCL